MDKVGHSRRLHVVTLGLLAIGVVWWIVASQQQASPVPKKGALTAPDKLTVAPASPMTFGDTTRLHFSGTRYMFGPGAAMAPNDPSTEPAPLVLGVGASLMSGQRYQLNTELGVGKRLENDAVNESLTHFSSSLTQSLNPKLNFDADYRILKGTSTQSEAWGLGLRYRLSAQSEWQLEHRENRGDMAGDGAGHMTQMEYRLTF